MSLFKDKVLLITGGTGSFGNAVLNRFLRTDIGEIRIFSRDEKKQDDMRHDFQARMPEVANKIKFYIGDVRNKSTLHYAMQGVDYVFHAAALKQVPSCEFFPMEAVKTNVIGTDNVLDAAIDAGVKCVICLSTDKAAYPINAMGISKAIEWRHQDLLHPLRQRYVQPRLCYSSMDRSDPQGQPHHPHRAQNDKVYNVFGRSSGPCALCL